MLNETDESDEDSLHTIEDILESHSFFDYTDPSALSALPKAVYCNDLNKVQELVAAGRSVNINDNHGNTPLHVAVLSNSLQILEYLLTLEETVVNVRNFDGTTPLAMAARVGQEECVRALLIANANTNLPNNREITPLHLAVNHPPIAHMLIKAGAYINAEDYNNDTPLHDAVTEDCLETVCMLLYYNADTNIRNAQDITPFTKALITENLSMQEVLFEYVLDLNVFVQGMRLVAFALMHNSSFVPEMIQRGADVNHSVCEEFSDDCFEICLRTTNVRNFEAVWPKYKNRRETCLLYGLADRFHEDSDDLEEYVNVIMESNYIEPFVVCHSVCPCIHLLIDTFVLRSVDLEVLMKFVLVLLMYNFPLCTADIDCVFEQLGYCELLKLLLHMNFPCSDNRYRFIVPVILYDVSRTIDEILHYFIITFSDDVYNTPSNIQNYSFKELLNYFSNPYLNQVLLWAYSDDDIRENEIKAKVFRLPKIPMLVELARNKARDYIIAKYNITRTNQYYSIINHFNMSDTYKKILSFETVIYY